MTTPVTTFPAPPVVPDHRHGLKHGTAANLTSVNPLLEDSEEVHETDTGKRKVGPGYWNDLDYSSLGATVEVGTVTTGDPGTDAEVTNSGTTTAAVLDFVIPQGEKGDAGLGSVAIDTGAGTDPLKFNGTELVSALSDLDGRYLAQLVLNALNYAPTCAGDGTTDDTTALQAEINTGKYLILTKKYKVTAPLTIPAGHPGIQLAAGCQVIKSWNAGSGSNSALFCNYDFTTALEGFSITGPGKIYNPNPTSYGGRVFSLYANDLLFDHFTVDGMGSGGFGVFAGDRMRINAGVKAINPLATTGVPGVRFLGGANFRCYAHVDSGDATFQYVPSPSDAYMPNNLDITDAWFIGCTGSSATAGLMQVSLHDPGPGRIELVTVTGAPTGGTFTLTYNAGLVTVTGGPTGGTFTLTYGGQTTAGIAYNATAAAVQSALQALSSVGSGNATVTGSTSGPWTASFTGAAAGKGRMTATSSLTGGTSPAVTVGQTTSALAYNAAASAVQSALQALSSVGAGLATVTGSAGGPWTVTFTSTAEGGGLLAPDPSSLTGGTSPNLTVAFLPTMISNVINSGFANISGAPGVGATAATIQNLDSTGIIDVDITNCKISDHDLRILTSTEYVTGAVTVRCSNSRFRLISATGTATNPIAAIHLTEVSTTGNNTGSPGDCAQFDGVSLLRWTGGSVDMLTNSASTAHGVVAGKSTVCGDVGIDGVRVKNQPSNSSGYGFYIGTVTTGYIVHTSVTSVAGASSGHAYYVTSSATGFKLEDNDRTGAVGSVTWQPTDALSSNRRNKGYNPLGNITAPSFPLTGVTYTNTTGYDLRIPIKTGSGVVVSDMAINGVSVGFGIGASSHDWIRLPAGDTFTPTITSGAPSWKFFAE